MQEAGSISSERKSLKRKGKNRSGHDLVQAINSVSEVSVVKQNKRKVKQSPVEDKQVELNATIITTEQMMSIKTDGISGTLEYNYMVSIDLCSMLIRFICHYFSFMELFLFSLMHVLSKFI